MRLIEIEQSPHYKGKQFFSYHQLTFDVGVTVLVGCNGSGKSTIIGNIKRYCKKNNIDCVQFDNLQNGASQTKSKAGLYGDFTIMASLMSCSEGEGIEITFGEFIKSLKQFVERQSDKKEKWILIDAIDRGLSIDNILEVKDFFDFLLQDKNSDIKVYIVGSSNAYEVANGEDCINVRTDKHIRFKDYKEYKQTILKTAEQRNELRQHHIYQEK